MSLTREDINNIAILIRRVKDFSFGEWETFNPTWNRLMELDEKLRNEAVEAARLKILELSKPAKVVDALNVVELPNGSA